MTHYRRRIPVIIEADQFLPGMPLSGVEERTDGEGIYGLISTPEGPRLILPGQYLITTASGVRCCCDGEKFEALYERVEE